MSAITLPRLSICVDQYVEGREFDKNDLPSPADPRATSREELALAKYKLWQPGQLLRVQFFDGEAALWERVEGHAREWLKYANLKFEFGNFLDAEIRITFVGNGYQSLVGTDAMQQPSWQPTMILGGFTKYTDETELQRVVLHEFGHAIGCVHEQSSPSFDIPWDKEKVYAYYWQHHKWDKEKVDNNIFKRYTASEVHFTAQHDPNSIMQYPVPKELTVSGFEIGWNTELSETDRIFIAKMYPR